MEKMMYLMLIEKSKTYNKMTKQVVTEHVENIRRLDDAGKLELCGIFKGYPGMAGMYTINQVLVEFPQIRLPCIQFRFGL